MKKYLKLELTKFNLKRNLAGIVLVILGMLLFETAAVLSGAASGEKDSFSLYLPWIMNLMVTACFVVYSAVFTVNLIIGEYTKKTILILFSYPVDRKKIILLKLGIVAAVTMCCIAAGNLLCNGYVIGIAAVFDVVDGSVSMEYILFCLKETAVGVIMGGFLSLIPFVAGMWKKSVTTAFISSVAVAGIYFEGVGIAKGSVFVWVLAAALAAAAVLGVWYTLRHKVEVLDSCS